MNERLYCADYRALNDPLEGAHRLAEKYFRIASLGTFLEPGEIRDVRSLIPERDPPPRVCSLSGSPDHFVLWSHYAAGHQGVAIEVNLEVTFGGSLVPVEYAPDLPSYGRTILGGATVRSVLSHKTDHWAYEQEYRVIQDDEYFDVTGKVTGLLLGSNIDADLQGLLEKIVPQTIPIYPTTIDWDNLRIVWGDPLSR